MNKNNEKDIKKGRIEKYSPSCRMDTPTNQLIRASNNKQTDNYFDIKVQTISISTGQPWCFTPVE